MRPEIKRSEWTQGLGLILVFAAAKLLIHILTSHGYGYFRDELYYLACSDRLAFGYVDQPPLSILLLTVQRTFLGDSLPALRLLPALAGSITVLLIGVMVRQLGGTRFAQVLAMLAAIAAPMYLGLNHFYSMNAFDLMFWAWAAYLTIRIIKEPRPHHWMLLGLVLGLGLENKISVLWLGFGLFVGFLFTSQRRHFISPWPWLAAAIAAVVFAPHILWQIQNGWPTIEFMRNATGLKMAPVAPLDFLSGQVLSMNPVVLPIWFGGLVFFFFAPGGRQYRLLGWAWLAVCLLLMLSGTSRANYLSPAYTWLFAGGGVAIERLFARFGERVAGILEPLAAVTVIAVGVLLAPLALPVLPVEMYITYAERLGIAPSTEERKEVASLPQFYADMHGWEEIVDTVAEAYARLAPEDRVKAAIFAPNYGVAGAIDFFGAQYDLPEAISGHNNYWLWGPRGHTGEVVIFIGGSEEDLRLSFGSVELGATVHCAFCMPYENNNPVWICRDLRAPLDQVWPNAKHFD
jgi:hypothetical protein